jgi:hypothetical protein
MKNLPLYLFAALTLAVILTMSSCTEVQTEKSPILTEEATVVMLVYSPSEHTKSTTNGTIIDGKGRLGLHTSTTTNTKPEQAGVVFECEHGKFYVGRKELYSRLKVGDVVTVSYQEIYRITKEGGQVTKKEFVDYDFIGAEKVPPRVEER